MMNFVVSAGHDEYPLNLHEPDLMQRIWPANSDELYELLDSDPDTDLAAMYRAEVGEDPGDWDLTWEHIYRVTAERSAAEAALTQLLADLSGEAYPGAGRIGPSGDDDTFDYWPSGCRLALAVAEQLGGDFPARAEATIKRVLNLMPDYREELTDKIGVS